MWIGGCSTGDVVFTFGGTGWDGTGTAMHDIVTGRGKITSESSRTLLLAFRPLYFHVAMMQQKHTSMQSHCRKPR